MPAARPLTAILAADVAGYSRLMGADEEGTRAGAGGPPLPAIIPMNHGELEVEVLLASLYRRSLSERQGRCQRRRENASAGRSKTASLRDAKCPHGKAFAAGQTG